MSPETDAAPVKSLSTEYNDPKPLSNQINTKGAEDSPFITPNGNTLYFFFTPDVRIPAEKQLLDEVTGIYVAQKKGSSWSKPEKVRLEDTKKLSLEGCFFAQENKAWFCSAREGYTGIHWFTADYMNNKWQNWRNADEELKTEEYKTGELHISSDGKELYFHTNTATGMDIVVSKRINGEWEKPEKIPAITTERDEGYPTLNPEGNELWFSRDYGIWRSKRINGE